jgi:hypothetical protein
VTPKGRESQADPRGPVPGVCDHGAERLQESSWAIFLDDYDFRRRPRPDAADASEDRNFIVLERTPEPDLAGQPPGV